MLKSFSAALANCFSSRLFGVLLGTLPFGLAWKIELNGYRELSGPFQLEQIVSKFLLWLLFARSLKKKFKQEN